MRYRKLSEPNHTLFQKACKCALNIKKRLASDLSNQFLCELPLKRMRIPLSRNRFGNMFDLHLNRTRNELREHLSIRANLSCYLWRCGQTFSLTVLLDKLIGLSIF